MFTELLNSFDFYLKIQFLLKDCHEIISETIEENIDLYSLEFIERERMLLAIEEVMDIIKKGAAPKFAIKKQSAKKRHLKLVPKEHALS